MIETAIKKPGILYRPMGISISILVVAILWMLFPGDPATLALVAVAILFLFGLKKPVWAVAALLVSQLTISSYMVEVPFNISLRLLLLLLTGIIIWRYRIHNQISLGIKSRRIIIPVLILITISIVANLVYSGFDYAYKDFRNMLVGVLIIIFLPAVTNNVKDLKILCGVAFIVITGSAIVAVIQHYQFLGFGQNTVVPGFLQQWGDQLRVPGMAESELELSYTLSAVALVILGILVAGGAAKNNKWLLIVSLVFIGLGLYFTYTRSALFALILGLIALFLFSKTRIKGEIILIILLFGVFFTVTTGIMEGQYIGGRDVAVQEESSMSRKILWQAGIAIAMDNPVLGIGGDQYGIVAPRYSGSVDPELIEWEESRYWGFSSLGGEAIHNDFLYMWVSFGTFALIAYLWLYFAILRNFLNSYQQSKNRFIKSLSVGLAAGLVAYGVNAFYHNCLATFSLFWILAGLSLATTKLASKNNVNTTTT